MRKLALLLFICGLTLPSMAQSYHDELSAEIHILRLQKIDTIIEVGSPEYHFFSHYISIKNVGEIRPSDAIYLFYLKNKQLLTKELLWYYDTISTRCLVSNEKVLDNDSLFRWMGRNLQSILSATIHPYIYKNEKDGAVYYQNMQADHPDTYRLCFYMGQDSIYKSVNTLDLTLRIPLLENENAVSRNENAVPENLNYTINTNTRLYKFFLWLKQYLDKSEDSFEFEKP